MPLKDQARPGALQEVILEKDFLPLLDLQARPFFVLARTLLELPEEHWEKGHMFRLNAEALELESFLDDFGARRNRLFGFLGELIASLRWLAQAAFTLQHTLLRLDSYRLHPEGLPAFQAELGTRLLWAKSGAVRLLAKVMRESLRLGLSLPSATLDPERFGPILAKRYLPESLGEEPAAKADEVMAELAARFLGVEEMVRGAFPVGLNGAVSDPSRFASRYCREDQVRVCQVAVHNLQSRYDTHIKNSALENQFPGLPRLRGHISIVLHLLECATCLVHLDERHENELRNTPTRPAIAELVDRQALLDLVIHFCITEACRFLAAGAGLARQALSRWSRQETIELTLPPGAFLHARPATRIITVVQHHGLPVEIEIAGQKADASSIMAVMILAGKNPGEKRVAFHGDPRVLADLELLFRSGLDRLDEGTLPEALSYLGSRKPGF